MATLQSHNLKEIAARYAVNNFVQAGMSVGLGSGSTAAYAVTALAERVRTEGLQLGTLVATSADTEQLARFHGLTVANGLTSAAGWLDVTIDGADEVDAALNLIKGGGGALVREKLVAARTRREVIVVDESKAAQVLGLIHPLPVMIVPYGWETTVERIVSAAGRSGTLRPTHTGAVFVSDDGLYCYDIACGPIPDPPALDSTLKAITGVVDHGLFCGIAQAVVIARAGGKVEVKQSS